MWIFLSYRDHVLMFCETVFADISGHIVLGVYSVHCR